MMTGIISETFLHIQVQVKNISVDRILPEPVCPTIV